MPAHTKVNLLSGTTAKIWGWEDIVTYETETAHVTQTTSLWEFGTSSNCEGKTGSKKIL